MPTFALEKIRSGLGGVSIDSLLVPDCTYVCDRAGNASVSITRVLSGEYEIVIVENNKIFLIQPSEKQFGIICEHNYATISEEEGKFWYLSNQFLGKVTKDAVERYQFRTSDWFDFEGSHDLTKSDTVRLAKQGISDLILGDVIEIEFLDLVSA